MDGYESQFIGFQPRRVLFSDSDGLEGAFRAWGLEALQLSRAEGENWAIATQLGELLVRATSISGRYRTHASLPAGAVFIGFDLGSDGLRHYGGQALDGNDVVVAFAGAQLDYVSPDHHRGANFGLPEGVAAAALAQRDPGAEALIRSASLYVMSHCGPQIARVRALGAEIFRLGSQPFGLQLTEHAYGDMVDALVGTLLMPWDRETATTFGVTHYQRLPIVRRAEEFMRANLGEALMLHDICGVARASERAVEYAFRDVYGVGAKQYLKLLRLDQVRHELKGPLADVHTVKEIAQRCGFWHMGHFSTGYRLLFGETPQQTRGQRPFDSVLLEAVAPAPGANDRISGWPDLTSVQRASA